MVRIKLISYLKQQVGFSEKFFDVSSPTRIRDLLPIDLPDDRLVIIINETEGGTMDSFVSGDDSVVIAPVFGGG